VVVAYVVVVAIAAWALVRRVIPTGVFNVSRPVADHLHRPALPVDLAIPYGDMVDLEAIGPTAPIGGR
jgi:hypothetical protein